MAALGNRQDPYMAFSFLVEIGGLVVGGFSEVSGLQIETAVETYREGGVNEYEHKFAGPTRYPTNLILKRGLTDSEALWQWYLDVGQGKIVRKSGTIFLLDAQQQIARSWNFTDAYPIKWVGPELRASSGAVAIETLELVHRGIS